MTHLPPEIENIWGTISGSAGSQRAWKAAPSTGNSELVCLHGTGALEKIDLNEALTPILGHPYLKGTLRTMDVLNGCMNQCATCLADSPLPSKIASKQSLLKLFSNRDFVRMLQPDSLRFGSCGDISDHPDAAVILEAALQATEGLNAQRLRQEDAPHTIKVYTNYRPRKEKMLDSILNLTEKHSARLMICMSLPFNHDDQINLAFLEYARRRSRFFRLIERQTAGAYPEIIGSLKWGGPKVGVWDVRHPDWLLMIGRCLNRCDLKDKVPRRRIQRRFRELEIEQRGYAKTYLNAEGLWLMVYGTAYESHTCRLFTPIRKDNIEDLARIPYHPDFPMPPLWPGKSGQRRFLSPAEVKEKEREYRRLGRRKMALRVL